MSWSAWEAEDRDTGLPLGGIIFGMHIRTFSPDAPVDALVQVLADDGALIVEGALDREILFEVRQEIDPLVAAAPLGSDAFDGYNTRRMWRGRACVIDFYAL